MKKLCVLVFTILLVIALVHGVSGEELSGDIIAEAIELNVPETEEILPVGDDIDTFGEDNDFSRNVAAVEAGNVVINAINFPDIHFRKYVQDEIDINRDRELSDKELMAVEKIEVPNNGIANLKGIERFPNLIWLNCGENQLASLNVSKNTKLEHLDCCSNQLTSLNVSKNTKLQYFDCCVNRLTSLDVSNNTELHGLYCSSNRLTTLDVSKNIELGELFCADNQLTSLDVRKSDMFRLLCSRNQLTRLYLGAGICFLGCSDNNLTSLDLSKNDFIMLSCYGNRIITLDVTNSYYLTLVAKKKPEWIDGDFVFLNHDYGENYLVIDPFTSVVAKGKTLYSLLPKHVTLGVKEIYSPTKTNGVIYLSSNKKIAKVDSKTGKITAIKPGTAKISAMFGSKTVAKCKVTMKKAPKKVTLDKSKLTLNEGKSATLKASISKETYTSKYTWTSSNKKVAKVNSKGKVTAVSKGTATITVETAGGVKATCKVKVKSNRIDLIKYIGTDYLSTIKKLGLKLGEGSSPEYYVGGATIQPYCNSTGKIWSIWLNSDKENKYSISGACLNKTLSEATAILKQNGWKHVKDNKDSRYNTINRHFSKTINGVNYEIVMYAPSSGEEIYQIWVEVDAWDN